MRTERPDARIENVCRIKNTLMEHLYHKPLLDPEEIYKEIKENAEILRPYVAHTSAVLHQALKDDKKILLEGQLGALKDTDHGIYPMVTSSSTLAGFGAIGAGVPPYAIQKIICVVKAYSSAVGAGAFVSELFGEEADELRRRGGDGGEFGATTGRPRRVGNFDAVATRYGCMMQGATEVALTVVDVLGYLDELKICVATMWMERSPLTSRTPFSWRSKAGIRNHAGLEVRHHRNYEVRRSAEGMQRLCGAHRRADWRSGYHGFQRSGKRRADFPVKNTEHSYKDSIHRI